MNEQQMNELLLQSLEHERGGVLVYEKALECAVNEELHQEWAFQHSGIRSLEFT